MFFPLYIHTNKFKNLFKYLETESNIILMFNPKNILSIKKSMLMNPMFKRKNWNPFSEESKKKLMLLKRPSLFLGQLSINNQSFNQSSIKKKLNWKSLMGLKNTLKENLEFCQLNSVKAQKYKRKIFLDQPSINNTLSNHNLLLKI